MMMNRPCLVSAVTVALCGLTPAAAGAAAPPRAGVVRIAPDGTKTELAQGGAFALPGQVALASDGTVYVAGAGRVDPATSEELAPGGGVYAFAPPAYRARKVLRGHGRDAEPVGVAVAPGAVSGGPFTTAALPGPQTLLVDHSSSIAATASAAYRFASPACGSLAEGDAPAELQVHDFAAATDTSHALGCVSPAGLAVEASGQLVATEGARVLRLDPATGRSTTVASGGLLKRPEGIAVAADGRLLVADGDRVIGVDPASGAQRVVAGGGPLAGVEGIAAAPDGSIYVSQGGPAVSLRVTATSHQRVSASGIPVTLSCTNECFFEDDARFASRGARSWEDYEHVAAGRHRFVLPWDHDVLRAVRRHLRTHASVRATIRFFVYDPDLDPARAGVLHLTLRR